MDRLPENVPVPLCDVSLDLAEGAHRFEIENAAAIEENWRREKEAQPRLFDGRLTMFTGHRVLGSALTAPFHMVRFATFMYWRKIEPVDGAEHFFAHAVLVSRDDCLIAVRMAAHTANAGKVYFAAGSFEQADLRGGRIDIAANMAREVGEETGLDLGEAEAEAGYTAWRFGGQTVLVRRYFFDLDADKIMRRISRHVGADPEPEIDCAVAIANSCALPAGLTSYMPGIIRWHFDDNPAA